MQQPRGKLSRWFIGLRCAAREGARVVVGAGAGAGAEPSQASQPASGSGKLNGDTATRTNANRPAASQPLRIARATTRRSWSSLQGDATQHAPTAAIEGGHPIRLGPASRGSSNGRAGPCVASRQPLITLPAGPSQNDRGGGIDDAAAAAAAAPDDDDGSDSQPTSIGSKHADPHTLDCPQQSWTLKGPPKQQEIPQPTQNEPYAASLDVYCQCDLIV